MRRKPRNIDRGYPSAVLVNDAELLNRIATAPKFGHQAHSLCHVESRAPEIDQVASLAQPLRRPTSVGTKP